MSKLFVVFCKQLSQAPKILKTKSYAKSLIKKSPSLNLKQFDNQQLASQFISHLISSNTKQILSVNESIPQTQILTTTVQIKQPQKIIESIVSKQPSFNQTPTLKLKDIIFKTHQININQQIIITKHKQGIYRYFKPSSSTQIKDNSIITLKILQNQNPGLTQISYYLNNQKTPLNTIFLGQKYSHHSQLIGIIYILKDLNLKHIQKSKLKISNPYIKSLLQIKNTIDPQIDSYLNEFLELQKQFDDIYIELYQNNYPQRLKLVKFNFY